MPLKLTEAGRFLAPGASQDGFEALHARVVARAQTHRSTAKTLTVTAGPAITAKWLAPRLYRIRQRAHPGDRVARFSARAPNLADFDRDDDGCRDSLWLWGGRGGWPLLEADHSARMDDPYDVCRRFRKEITTLERSADQAQHCFRTPMARMISLHPPCDWRAWFQGAVGHFEGDPPVSVRSFRNADHVYRCGLVRCGSGVVLAPAAFRSPRGLWRTGRLVASRIPIAITTRSPITGFSVP